MSHKREPVKPTCPDIDKFIRKLREVYSEGCHSHKYGDEDSLRDAVNDCTNIISDAIYFLDRDMREANDSLRVWGVQEAEEKDALQEKYDKLESTYENVCSELEEIKAEHVVLHEYVRSA